MLDDSSDALHAALVNVLLPVPLCSLPLVPCANCPACTPVAHNFAKHTENASVCGAVTRDDVASVVIKALLSDKVDGKVRE